MIPNRLFGDEFGLLIFSNSLFSEGDFLSGFFEDGEVFALVEAGLDEVDALHD
jgi:hypothetical protein